MRELRILQVVASVSAEASGPSYSVPRLAQTLAEQGHAVELITVGGALAAFAAPDVTHIACRHDFALAGPLGTLWFSSEMRRVLDARVAEADLVHVHGLWAMPNVYPAAAARRHGKPLVISPRGTLSAVALARSSRRKALFWRLAQRRAVRSAALLHATAQHEWRDIRDFGLTQPVLIAANGVDLPPARRKSLPRRRRLLYLGRLHPIKGLENLLQAWARIEDRYPLWDLRLVGPGDATYVTQLQALARRLKLTHFKIVDAKYGEQKSAEYLQAELFILPSFSENFGMSVAEALAHAIPVVTTTGTAWGRLEAEGCGWVVNPTEAALEACLAAALRVPRSQLATMGQAGRCWMEREFSWSGIGRETGRAYSWILGGGERPTSVRLE